MFPAIYAHPTYIGIRIDKVNHSESDVCDEPQPENVVEEWGKRFVSVTIEMRADYFQTWCITVRFLRKIRVEKLGGRKGLEEDRGRSTGTHLMIVANGLFVPALHTGTEYQRTTQKPSSDVYSRL